MNLLPDKFKNISYSIVYALGYFVLPIFQSILLICVPGYVGILVPAIITTVISIVASINLGIMYRKIYAYNVDVPRYRSFISLIWVWPIIPDALWSAQYYFHISVVWMVYQVLVILILIDTAECAVTFICVMGCIISSAFGFVMAFFCTDEKVVDDTSRV